MGVYAKANKLKYLCTKFCLHCNFCTFRLK